MKLGKFGEPMSPERRSIYSYFADFAAESPDKRFFFEDDGRVFSVKETFDSAIAAANDMVRLGAGPGSLIVLRSTRSLDASILYYACEFLGATVALTDPHSGAKAFIEASGVDMKPDFYLTNENYGSDLAQCGGWECNGTPIKIRKAPGEQPLFDVNVDIDAPACIIFTSGSTGKSKGVTLSQYNIMNHIRNFSVSGSYREEDNQMEALPVHHVFGLAVILMGMYVRYETLFPKTTDVDYIAGCIDKYKLTRLDGVPSFALALARKKVSEGYDLSSLRVGVVGGAPVTPEQFSFIEETLGLIMVPVYGMSECIGITSLDDTYPRDKRCSSVGKWLPMSAGEIAEDGEICVRAPSVMLYYWGDPDATAAAKDPDGLLHTGDLGYMDAEGYVHITGRKKDIIIRNGLNLSAVDIENGLKSLPYVIDACVVGIKDETRGEMPCALVVKKGEGDLISDMPKVLKKNEIPELVQYADAIPLLSSGKPDKMSVKKLFEQLAK